jgi:hypothetical protein
VAGSASRCALLRRPSVLSLSWLIRANRHDSPLDAAIADALPAEEKQRPLQSDAFFVDLDVDVVLREVVDALKGRCLSSILPIRPTTAGVKTQMARHRLASVTLKRGTWPAASSMLFTQFILLS